jgi:hypothetical protein
MFAGHSVKTLPCRREPSGPALSLVSPCGGVLFPEPDDFHDERLGIGLFLLLDRTLKVQYIANSTEIAKNPLVGQLTCTVA